MRLLLDAANQSFDIIKAFYNYALVIWVVYKYLRRQIFSKLSQLQNWLTKKQTSICLKV